MKTVTYFSIIKFALKNIFNIKNKEDVVNYFQSTIQDITVERNNQLGSLGKLLLINTYLGQETHFFKFYENKKLFGEFSLDFLPRDPKKIAKYSEMNLCNFRVQLFCDSLFQRFILNKKYKVLIKYINEHYGLPNKTKEAIKCYNILKNQLSNQNIKCWHFENDNKHYIITLYIWKKIFPRPYISFSVSEAFQILGGDIDVDLEKEKLPRILYFEDDDKLAEMIGLGIEKFDFHVVQYPGTPEDKEKLINLVLKENPDIIVTDIIHPGIDGFQMTEVLKLDNRTKHIPIYAFTSLGQKEDIERGMKLGMSDYFIKAETSIKELANRLKMGEIQEPKPISHNQVLLQRLKKLKKKTEAKIAVRNETILDKTMELIESSTRPMAAKFCSGNGRNETFGINFDPITPEIDSNMAAESYGSIGIYFSKDKTNCNLTDDQFYLILIIGEDIMVGSFIITKLGGEKMIDEMRKRIIDFRIKNVGDKVDKLEEAISLIETNDYFDYCSNFGSNLAKKI